MTKKFSFTKNTLRAVLAVAIVAVLAVAATVYWNNSSQKDSIQQPVQDSRPDIEDVLTVEGEVTMIFHSCGAESIHSDEDVSKYAMCGKAEGIRVDDKIIINTSSAGVDKPRFNVDISSIELGDIVSVRYVTGENQRSSLNCKDCSVVKED